MTMTRRSPRDENGATAILVAILAVAMFTVAAIAVDMGQVYAKRAALQSNVDMAVLAAAKELTQPTGCNAEVVTVATQYLQKPSNKVHEEAAYDNVDLTGAPNDADGFIQCTGWRVKLWAPKAWVDYGIGEITGLDGVDVPAFAAAQVGSPGMPAPFFIPTECDFPGPQVVKAGAQSPDPQPQFPSTDPDGTGGGQPDISAVNPPEVPVETPAVDPKFEVTVHGTNFGSTQLVSFTRDTVTHYSRVTPLVPAVPTEGTVVIDSATQLRVTVPDQVAEITGTWFVRVKNANGWSRKQHAVGVKVVPPASANPDCGSSNEGDFGMIDSPRNGSVINQQQRFVDNLAFGLDHLLDPWNPPSSAPDSDIQKSCKPTASPIPGAILDDTADDRFTPPAPNCVNILNGNRIDMATDGLVKRLNKPTTDGCDPFRGSGEVQKFGRPEMLNNDTLSCFLTPGTTIAAVSQETISSIAHNTVSDDIFNSPRFMWLPQINSPVAPSNGFYPVVRFLPSFITDESGISSSTSSNATSANGIVANPSGNNLGALWVVPINPDAMPDGASTYTGPIGPPIPGATIIVRLVE